MKKRWWLMVICSGLLLVSISPISAQNNWDEAQIRELIIRTIKENPKILVDVINQYLHEQQQKKDLPDDQLDKILSTKRVQDTVRPHNPAQGPEQAPVTIIEYSNFQCPHCGKASQTIMDLASVKPGTIRRIFKNRPFAETEQDLGLVAAKAAMAAAKQGKFWEYHDLMFLSAPGLDEAEFLRSAVELGLDLKRFNHDRQSAEISAQIRQDVEDAEKLNIDSTPTIILNGLIIKGAMSFNHLMQIIQRLTMTNPE